MPITAQPPDPNAPPAANDRSGRFELALVAAFKAGAAAPATPRVPRPPPG